MHCWLIEIIDSKGINKLERLEINILSVISQIFIFLHLLEFCGSSSVGRASASQAEGRGFESHLLLKKILFT